MEWDVVSSMDGWTVNGTVWTATGNTSYSVPHPHLKAELSVNKTWQFNLNGAENR